MTRELAEILGAMAAAFVGTIIIDMWLGGGLLGGLSPGRFNIGMGNANPASNGGGVATANGGATVSSSSGIQNVTIN